MSTEAQGGPVITSILGSCLYLGESDASLRTRLAELKGKFSLSWEPSPEAWIGGIIEDQPQIDFVRKKAGILRENGIGGQFCFGWNTILPLTNQPEFSAALLGVTLDPATSRCVRPKDNVWDYGSAKARAVFAQRARKLFEKMGPMEMFTVDEVVMASPGKEGGWQINRISTYWTSPTYSAEALKSFREYLRKKGYPLASQAKFPVTTVAVPASAEAGDGLPAIKIDETNRERLVEDNLWPASVLWSHWYDWREDLYASWVDAVTTAAYDVWGKLPRWQGCMLSQPVHCYRRELGPNLDKLGALPHVDYLVGGYMTGKLYASEKAAAIKAAARRHGKKWGGMVELNYYGQKKGNDPAKILESFQYQVNAGASLMLVYPGTAFRKDRPEPSENGLYYLPDQVAAWDKCLQWLEQGRTCKRIVSAP